MESTVAYERLTLIMASVISCLTQHPLPLQTGDSPACLFFWMKSWRAHLRVARHDGVVAIIIQRGRDRVQGAGSVSVAADPVVLAALGDLFAIFEPVDLPHKTANLR